MLETAFYLTGTVVFGFIIVDQVKIAWRKLVRWSNREMQADLRLDITNLLAKVPDETLRAKAAEAFKSATTVQSLMKIKSRLIEILSVVSEGAKNV